ncbi:uncharacterized protein LOC131146513 [Malania oleifera]|uniref:uncharacterized protein LOC131146513 n=1 Tax=Malania oleifera TaxID=397392 RepID=UPI0025ADB803|nr:uncharacterized protein LOC131146513 [Malania oleifera]
MGENFYYHCGRLGHRSWSCEGPRAQEPVHRPFWGGYKVPRGGRQRNTTPTRVYALMLRDAEATGDVVTGSTHSFISLGYAKLSGIEAQQLDVELLIATPTGSVMRYRRVLKKFPMDNQEKVLAVDLVLVSEIQVRKLLQGGFQDYIVYIKEMPEEEVKQADIPLVKEFLDVFPYELLGLSPKREI